MPLGISFSVAVQGGAHGGLPHPHFAPSSSCKGCTWGLPNSPPHTLPPVVVQGVCMGATPTPQFWNVAPSGSAWGYPPPLQNKIFFQLRREDHFSPPPHNTPLASLTTSRILEAP